MTRGNWELGLVNKPVGGEPSAAPARSRPALGNAGTGKNIRSLADLQKAIQKADRVKKQAQVKGKIDQARRERQKKLTAEERKAIRQSKRLTVELQHSESRVKVSFFSFLPCLSFPVFPLLPSCFFLLKISPFSSFLLTKCGFLHFLSCNHFYLVKVEITLSLSLKFISIALC